MKRDTVLSPADISRNAGRNSREGLLPNQRAPDIRWLEGMKLAIMQPYFFPYLGYFELIHRTDRWVVFDTAQYIRHGWVNRNRILHPSTGWQYVIAPLQQHHREAPISDVKVHEGRSWRDRLCGQLVHYKKKAPYYAAAMGLVEDCLDNTELSLARLNVTILDKVCRYLQIPFRYEYFSEMKLDLGPVGGPGDWALRISEALGASEYVNPPGGEALFDKAKFAAVGIELTFQEFENMTYQCNGYVFEPALSIIDVLMWNSAATVVRHLEASDVCQTMLDDSQRGKACR